MRYRINADALLLLMQQSDWNKALKTGYEEGENYFEFGILPLSLPFKSEQGFVSLLNHHLFVYFLPTPSSPKPLDRGDMLICVSDKKAGLHDTFVNSAGYKIPVFYITCSQWEQCQQEAEMIKNDYQNVRGGFFISIPNKWYEETNIIKIVNQLYPVVPRPAKSRFPFGFMEN